MGKISGYGGACAPGRALTCAGDEKVVSASAASVYGESDVAGRAARAKKAGEGKYRRGRRGGISGGGAFISQVRGALVKL